MTGKGISSTGTKCIKNKVKVKQLGPDKEEREVVYSKIAWDMEKTRDVVRRSMS